MTNTVAKNVLGTPLELCCNEPKTGFFRDGFCRTDERDQGNHSVCAELTETFLTFSKRQGNDLVTPMPEYGFPGLKSGDCWCLCASRWLEAFRAEVAPPVKLSATHERALEIIPLQALKSNASDLM